MADQTKHPDEVEIYSSDFSAWLTANGGTTIAATSWTLDPADGDLTLDDGESGNEADGVCTNTVSGGVNGRYYVVRVEATDSDGNVDVDEFGVRVVQ